MPHKIIRVEVSALTAQNIRTSMDGAALEKLAASLKKGQRFPIIITSSGKIIDGHRRVAAAQIAGITHLDALVVDDDLTPEQITELQTIHAFHSETLGDSDKAHALKAKKDASGFGNKQLAEHFDISPSTVTQLMSLFDCIPAVQELAAQGKLGHTKWYAISTSPDQDETLRLLANGATRDQIQRSGKKAKNAGAVAVRASRIKCPLQSGVVIQGAGDGLTLEDFIESLAEAQKLAKAALSKGLNASTAVKVWADMAAAG